MAIAASFPSIKPSLSLDFANVGALDPRVTFTRSTTGTYYDGVTTAKAEENLLVQSQTFNTTWFPQSVTVGSDVEVAPDGSATADKVQETTDTSTHLLSQTITFSATPYTLSVYLKAAERGYALVTYITATGISVNLSTGAVSTAVGSPTNVTSVDAGNGWWRVSFTFTPIVSTSFVYIYTSTDGIWANRSYTGSTGSGIYIWGAQLEQRSQVTAYTPTTTQPITNYIPVLQTAAAGQARFDHNPTTGEALGLLIEAQRTNLLTYSEQFDNAVWTQVRSSITANTIVAPDGTLTGDKLVEDTTASNTHVVLQIPAASSSTTYTYSVFLKAAERTRASIQDGGGSSAGGYFDLSNGTVISTNVTATITSVGNGWYRCTITFTTNVAQTNVNARIFLVDTGTNITYTGDGYSGIFIWGAQLEAGAFPTSYIPTTSAQVTRNADAASMTGTNFSSWYNAGEGTMYAEAATASPNVTVYNWAISSGSASSNTIFRYAQYVSDPGTSTVFGYSQATLDIDMRRAGTATANVFYKSATAMKANDFAYVVAGGSAAIDTTAGMPVVDRINIGASPTNTSFQNGHIKKLAYYPQRLTDAQLQALTA